MLKYKLIEKGKRNYMRKSFLQEINLNKSKKIATTEGATVIKLNNGNILKIYHPGMVEAAKLVGIDIEAKILSAEPIKNSPEILIPTAAVYMPNGTFCGYIMPCARGIDYNTYDDRFTHQDRENLDKYAKVHYKLESVLRRNPNIVFPDFCTCDNIFIDARDNVQFIDYEGIQIGNYRPVCLSTSLGNPIQYINNPKYFTKNQLFTKELDKKSSIILFYLTAFNIDLNKVGTYNPFEMRNVTLDDIFQMLNLDDLDLCHKTWKIFNNKESNEFLGSEILKLSEKYDLKIIAERNGMYVKRLVRKK